MSFIIPPNAPIQDFLHCPECPWSDPPGETRVALTKQPHMRQWSRWEYHIYTRCEKCAAQYPWAQNIALWVVT